MVPEPGVAALPQKPFNEEALVHDAGAVAVLVARVLVVDDDPAGRLVLQRALARAGYEVEIAHDGIEALAKLRHGADLVLMDAAMPGLDGFEVTRRIRLDPAQHDLPILMVTGMATSRDRLRAAQAGVTDFITKPYELTDLWTRCAALLGAGRAAATTASHAPDRVAALPLAGPTH